MVTISSGPQCDAVLLQSKWTTTRHSLHKTLTPQRWISPIKQVKWEVRLGLLWFIGSMEVISYLKTSKALYLRTRKESNIGLTHWGRVMHICVIKLTIIGSDNGLSPGQRQAIIRTNAGILLIWTSGTNFSEMLSEILTFSFMKIHLQMSSGKWRQFCLGLNVLIIVHGITGISDFLIGFLLNFK